MLQRIDRALGFDWPAGMAFLRTHDLIAAILKYAYNSMVYQGLYFGVLLALMNNQGRMRQMFWLVLVAGLLTSLGVLLWPALGPFEIFHARLPTASCRKWNASAAMSSISPWPS